MQLNLFHSQEARSEKKALISNNNARAKYESCTRWRFLTVIATVVLVSYLNGKNKAYIFARLLLNYFFNSMLGSFGEELSTVFVLSLL